eukprot:5917972-Prymnesium_polylepis.1
MRGRSGARRNGRKKRGSRTTRQNIGSTQRKERNTPPGMQRAMAALVARVAAGRPEGGLLRLELTAGAPGAGSRTAGVAG